MIMNLFKINFLAIVAGILQIRQKKNSSIKVVALIAFFVFAMTTMMMAFGSLFYVLRDPLFDEGIGWFYFSIQAGMSFALSVLGTIFSAQSLFISKDNEMLLSMPIKPGEILISRILVILVFEYIFHSMVAIPAFIVWVQGGYATGMGVIVFLINYMFLPLMALSVACLVAWLLSLVLVRFKRKNILTLAMSISLLLLYMYLYSQIQNYLDVLLSRGVEISEAFRRAMPPFYAFGVSIADISFISTIEFLAWAVIPFILIILIISMRYQKILTTNKGMPKSVYKEQTAKASGACGALVKKELTFYFSKPMVILNTSISSVFMLLGTVVLLIRNDEFLEYFAAMSSNLGNLSQPVLAAAILAFMGCMNNLSASLISLEGKNFWIAQSIPVHPKVVFLSKIYTHLLTSAIPCLLLSVTITFFIASTAADALLVIVFPQTLILLMSVCGLTINLMYPRFDWVSEIQPVKHGISAMITIFGSMGLIASLGIIYFVVISRFIGMAEFLWLLALIFIVSSFILWKWLSIIGSERILDM